MLRFNKILQAVWLWILTPAPSVFSIDLTPEIVLWQVGPTPSQGKLRLFRANCLNVKSEEERVV